MKKSTLLVAVVLLSAIFMSFALAEDRKAPAKDKDDMKAGMMGSHDMCGTMMGSMMGHCMVASGDGGVVVMMGDKLQKYDKDLNLVKEIQVAVDMEHMSARMAQMMATCPMHKKMMQGGEMEKYGKNEKNEKNEKQ
jgi:hypothetical protein